MVQNRDQIISIIGQNKQALRSYGVRRLGLFGSFSRNQATASSDLDFLVELEKKTFDAYMGLKIFLEDLFQCRVDLVLSDSLKTRLRDKIIQETVYVPGL